MSEQTPQTQSNLAYLVIAVVVIVLLILLLTGQLGSFTVAAPILLLIAVVCFFLDGFRVATGLNLVSLGFGFVALSLLVG